MENKTSKKLVIVIISIIMLLIGISFAWYTININSTKNNVLKAGTLSLIFDDETSQEITLDKAIPVTDEEGLEYIPYTFTLENNGNINSEYTIYLDDVEITGKERINDTYIKYSLEKNNEAPTIALLSSTGRIMDTGVIIPEEKIFYKLRIWVDYDATNEAMDKEFKAKLRIEATQTKPNENIKAVYKYNEVTGASDYCVSGEETTCKQIAPTTYEMGTIVKYAVNATEDKYFYVLHDDGDTLTMQQRENIVRNIAWYADANDNTQGPTTALTALESATSTWTNVNDQTYTLGTTNFNNTNAFTGCTYSSKDYKLTCNANTYVLPERTAKARMITGQEVASTTCLVNKDGSTDTTIIGNSINSYNFGSCPDWMHNYLYQSTSYGGSYNDNTATASGNYNLGYWTTSTYSYNSAQYINRFGYIKSSGEGTSDTDIGARAVIVINK